MGICLVLSGGGARGIAHVAAIRVLLENNIAIDSIVGTSAGAMIGGLYAMNPDIDWLEKTVLAMNKSDVVKWDWSTMKGYSKGTAFLKHMNQYLHNADFSELKIPFTALAADLNTGELVPINTGNVAMAQLCSCALPPIYAPVEHMGRTLIDGGCVESVGCDYARSIVKNNTPIVAVHVGIHFPTDKVKSIWSILMRFIIIRTIHFDNYCASSADVIIRPAIPGIQILDDSDKQGYLQKGREAALLQIDKIKALIK